MNKLKALILSDFNLEGFSGYLSNDATQPHIEARFTGYGQVMTEILNPHAEKSDVIFVWTQPQSVLASFKKNSEKECLSEVDAFAEALLKLKGRARLVFVASWSAPLLSNPGINSFRPESGLAYLLHACNLRLAQQLSTASSFAMLDSNAWLLQAGKNAYSHKLWYLSKTPFHFDVFKVAIADLKSATSILLGQSKKLILLDLDDTLWGGILGDVGWQNLKLGGHDPVGEAFKDFQSSLKELKSKGILLGIISRNEEKTALEAIQEHPEMVLRLEDFAGHRINWGDKAENIKELVSELKLGMQSVVFIDDSAVERARAREAFPDLLVPEWPTEKMAYTQALHTLRCFDQAQLTSEDLARSRMIHEEKARENSKQTFLDFEDWLRTLEIKVSADKLGASNLQRVTQLFNKTNQLNLTTRRLTEEELSSWSKHPDHYLWAIKVEDRFGDSGLVGVVSLVKKSPDTALIQDFILSCRVIGRKIEETLLSVAVAQARKLKVKEVIAEYMPTEKNKPCFEFWSRSGFEKKPSVANSTVFRWNASKDYAIPEAISLIRS